jgi:DedD protein
MAERIADNALLIVDEMKRKARRRLVGAIVLALAAAIIVPTLLEKEPRPLGDDVSVQIPPVDEGKFVNRLTGKAGDAKALPKADGKANAGTAANKPEPKPEVQAETAPPPGAAQSASPAPTVAAAGEPLLPRKSVADAEQRVIAPPPKPALKADAKAAATPEAKSEPKAAPKTDAKPSPAPESNSGPKPAGSEARPAAGAALQAPPAATAAAPAKSDGFVVQLAAFADDKGANALANKLKKSGYAAYVQPVETSRGTLWRVRVGGYGSRPDADAARVILKGEGYSGIVAPAQ